MIPRSLVIHRPRDAYRLATVVHALQARGFAVSSCDAWPMIVAPGTARVRFADDLRPAAVAYCPSGTFPPGQ